MVKTPMIKKIIAFGYVNLSDHWASLFYLDKLYQEGFEIEYLNIDLLTLRQNDKIQNSSTYIKQTTVNSIDEFERTVCFYRGKAIFLPCVTIGSQVWRLFTVLLKHKAKYIYIHVGELPSLDAKVSSANLREKLKKLFSKHLVHTLLFNYQKRMICSGLHMAFVAGGVAEAFHRKNGSKRIVRINVRDYDNGVFSEPEEENQWEAKKYWVFLDGYLPYHPDNPAHNIHIEPESYYRSINNFFDLIERKYMKKIIVAAHPKSEYEKKGNKFNGREIIKGQTENMVKSSELVLNHESSAMTYAIIHNKPMIFLITSQIDRETGWYGRKIRFLANLLGCVCINIDDEGQVDRFDLLKNNINIQKREHYKYQYLTSKESETKKSGKIILAGLN